MKAQKHACFHVSPFSTYFTPHNTAPCTQYVVDSLQGVLEVAETPLLLEAVVKNIVAIAKFSPQHLSHHFKVRTETLFSG